MQRGQEDLAGCTQMNAFENREVQKVVWFVAIRRNLEVIEKRALGLQNWFANRNS